MATDRHEQISPAPCSSPSSPDVMDTAENGALRWIAGVCSIPKENKAKPQGEDANFVCEEKQTIGVADGVGGWSKHDIDSGEYSRQLMSNSVLALKQEPCGGVDLQRVLNYAYSDTKAKGSSTACIITLRGHSLHAVNIGDSGFRVLRGGNCIYRSPIQQSGFNCPYQLGYNLGNHPSSAQTLEVLVEAGDVVVAGTDGLFDNMYDIEIEDEVKRGFSNGLNAQEIAYKLAELALYNSFDRFIMSPFAMASATAPGNLRSGGKIDDITVIVAYVVS